jgi:hypothetical protein
MSIILRVDGLLGNMTGTVYRWQVKCTGQQGGGITKLIALTIVIGRDMDEYFPRNVGFLPDL